MNITRITPQINKLAGASATGLRFRQTRRRINLCLPALGLLVGGCMNRPDGLEAAYIAYDRSASTSVDLGQYHALTRAIQGPLPPGTPNIVYRFDSTISEIYNGPIKSSTDLWGSISSFLEHKSSRPGTRMDLLMQSLLADLPHRTEKHIVIVLVTDYGNTGSALRPYATQLSQDHRIQALWLVGSDSHKRMMARNDFTSFHRRLIVSGTNDIAAGLAQFSALVREN